LKRKTLKLAHAATGGSYFYVKAKKFLDIKGKPAMKTWYGHGRKFKEGLKFTPIRG